jgi:hypothetical protein
MPSSGDRRPRVAGLAPSVIAAALVLAPGWLSTAARAADPTAAPSPSPSPALLPIQAWLDRPEPSAAAPGEMVTIGATMWDPSTDGFSSSTPGFVRIVPATGPGPASEAIPQRSEAWHVTASLRIPTGGYGALEIGVAGSACGVDGCVPTEILYTVAGVGPPTGASLPQIADATIQPLLGAPVAGAPFEVAVTIRPKVDWPASTLPMPDRLILRGRMPRGAIDTEVPLLRDAGVGPDVVFAGTMTLSEVGPSVLDVATTLGASDRDVFVASAMPVMVVPSSDASEPGTGGDGSSPISLDALLALLALSAASVLGVTLLLRGARRDH